MEDEYEQVITKMKDRHCELGPESCTLCKEANAQSERFMLLSLELKFAPSGEVLAQPLLRLKIDGKPTYTPYIIKKVFDSEQEASEYSKKHKIEIVENLAKQ